VLGGRRGSGVRGEGDQRKQRHHVAGAHAEVVEALSARKAGRKSFRRNLGLRGRKVGKQDQRCSKPGQRKPMSDPEVG